MSDQILVGVRVRPLISREVSDSSALHWSVGDDNIITNIEPGTTKSLSSPYKFDRIFDSDYENEDIYSEMAEPIVQSALAGFNGTIFAYGQTSSGKTFTMMGDGESPGIIPLTISNIFQAIENTPGREYLIRVSFMEIYNETITDLLCGKSSNNSKGLNVREDGSGQIYVADLTEKCCNNEEKLLSLMQAGNKCRTVGSTNMNDRSSRSHTIFRLILESRDRCDGDDADKAVVVSHLNLVDLAGSENASQTGATGDRLKEGGFINKSLFMLGRVISQLAEGEQYINYRDSKLTRILQLSLGGNAKTAIICTVTPASVDQTHSTLRFASRAKSIKNKPIVNEVLSDAALLKRYTKEINALKKQLDKERETDKAQEVEQVRELLDEEAKKNQELETRINSLKEMFVVTSILPVLPLSVKSKKLRRETWAAPRAGVLPFNRLRHLTQDSPVSPLKPLNLTNQFLRPELPPWSDRCRRSTPITASPTAQLNFSNNSTSDSFMIADDLEDIFESAEKEKLDRLCADTRELSTPTKPEPKRKKQNNESIVVMCSVECQTDESLLPKMNLLSSPRVFQSPSRSNCSPLVSRSPVFSSPTLSSPTPGSPAFSSCSSPGTTPKHVLRSKNMDLEERLKERDEWLDNWKHEINELRDYQKTEIDVLEENFRAKLEEGPMDEEKISAFKAEIKSLHLSQRDSEALLMDANKELASRGQQTVMLQMELSDVRVNHIEAEGLQEELSALKGQHKQLQDEMCKKNDRLSQLENERGDFDMMMELSLQKQKKIEADLRRSLDEAWGEIAVFEGGNKEEITKRSNKMLDLMKELDTLKEKASDDGLSEKVSNLERLLRESEIVSQETVAELGLEESKLSQEILLKEEFQSSNVELRSTVKSLQFSLDQRELQNGAEMTTTRAYEDRITSLQQEVDVLRNKLSGNEGIEPNAMNQSIAEASVILGPASELTKKLSQTLQVLEASICVQDNNATIGSSIDSPLSVQELLQIKDQLLILQEALIMQDAALQKQEATEKKMNQKMDCLTHAIINNKIESAYEREVNVYHMFEALTQDFLMSERGNFLSTVHIPIDICTTSQTNEEFVEKTIQESMLQLKNELEKIKEEKASLEIRLQQNTFIEGDTLYMPRRSVAPICRPSMNFSFSDMLVSGSNNNTTAFATALDSSILQFDASGLSEDVVQELRQQLEILNSENAMLSQKITHLQAVSTTEEAVDKFMILIKEKEALEMKLKEANISYEDLQSLRWQVDSLKEEKDGLVIDLRESQTHLKDLENSITEEKSSAFILEEKLTNMQSENEILEKELNEMKLNGKGTDHHEEITALKSQIDLLSKENTNLTDKLNDAEPCNKQDETQNSEIEQLILRFTEKEEAFEETIEKLKDQIQTKEELLSSFEKDNARQNEDLEKIEIQEKIDTADKKCKEIENAFDNKCISLQNMQEKYTELESTVKTLEKSLEEKENHYSTIDIENNSMKEEIDTKIISSENQLEDIKRKYQESENEKEQLKLSNNEYEMSLKALKDEYEKLSSNIKDKSSDQLGNLSFTPATPNRMSNVTNDSQINAVMTQKMDEYEKLKDNHTAILKEQKELKNNYENIKIMFDKKIDELKQVKLECEEQVGMYSKDISQKEDVLRENEKISREDKDKLESLHMAIQAKDHKIQRLQTELESLKCQIEEKNHDLQQSIDSADTVNSARIEELQNENKRIENMYEEVCEARKLMSDAIKAKGEQIVRLTSQLGEDKGTIDELRRCAQEKAQSSNSTVKDLGELNYQVDSLNVKLEEKEKEISVINSKKSELISKLEKESQNVDIKNNEVKELLNEIVKLKYAICNLESSKQDIDSEVLNKNIKELSEKDNQIQELIDEIEEKNKCLDKADMKLSQSEALNEEYTCQIKNITEKIVQKEPQNASNEQNLMDENNCLGDNKYITIIEEMKIKVEDLEDKLTGSTKTGKVLEEILADKEKEFDSLQESNEDLAEKLKEYKIELEILRESDGSEQGTVDKLEDVIAQKSQLENELSASHKRFEALADEHSDWKSSYTKLFEEKEKMVAQLKHRSILPSSPKGTLVTTNLGSVFIKDLGDADIVKKLTQEHQQLSEVQEEHLHNLQQLNNLTKECNKLKDDKLKLEKSIDNYKNSALDVSLDEEGLQHKYLAVQRDNEELKMRLKALDAPSKKEAQHLKQELELANNKLVHTRSELRRLQNNQVMDSTINEIQNLRKDAAQADYNSGSAVVQEVNVLSLKNQLYHLEKEKGDLTSELTALTQHLDHYKKKAQEWKDNATKEKKGTEKLKTEVKHFLKENGDLRSKLEDSNNQLEKKAFELGHQREIVEKLQQDQTRKTSGADKCNVTTRRTRSTASRKQSDIHTLVEEAALEISLLDTPSKQSKDTDVGAELQPHMINSQTGANQDPQQQDEKIPMWRQMGKENKNLSKYSKYYNSPSSKKNEEDCKTQ